MGQARGRHEPDPRGRGQNLEFSSPPRPATHGLGPSPPAISPSPRAEPVNRSGPCPSLIERVESYPYLDMITFRQRELDSWNSLQTHLKRRAVFLSWRLPKFKPPYCLGSSRVCHAIKGSFFFSELAHQKPKIISSCPKKKIKYSYDV